MTSSPVTGLRYRSVAPPSAASPPGQPPRHGQGRAGALRPRAGRHPVPATVRPAHGLVRVGERLHRDARAEDPLLGRPVVLVHPGAPRGLPEVAPLALPRTAG